MAALRFCFYVLENVFFSQTAKKMQEFHFCLKKARRSAGEGCNMSDRRSIPLGPEQPALAMAFFPGIWYEGH